MPTMPSAPKDGTPVKLWNNRGWVIASFWTPARSKKEFGGKIQDYRAGWFLGMDDTEEFDNPTRWELLF